MPAPAPPPTGSAPTIVTLIRRYFGTAFTFIRGFSSAENGHHGLDLSARKGTPIRAAANGIVSYAENESVDPNAPIFVRGGGNVVNLEIGGDFVQSYAHLESITVRPGQRVKIGDVIGTVGMTGGPSQYYPNIQAPTGPHLHLAVWSKNTQKFVNPEPFLRQAVDTGSLLLGGWDNLIVYPDGHVLTAADVDDIMRKLSAAKWFDGIGGKTAYDTTRRILISHIGEPWNKSLQEKLLAEIGQAATDAANNPAQAIADALTAFAGFLATLLNPANWIRILALLAGAAMAAFGAVSIMRASA